MGFGVAKPWGDSDRYDLVVDVDGRLLKVQVKSAHCVSASPGGGYNLRCCGHRRKSYTAAEIDILVGYIATENIWYIFPPRAFKKMRSLRLFPHHTNRRPQSSSATARPGKRSMRSPTENSAEHNASVGTEC
jgi:hypothetical protein